MSSTARNETSNERGRFVFLHRGREIAFECPSEITFNRCRHLLTKEPGTIAWIDSFERDAMFWDIGANIGTFSLYAAVFAGSRVTAFEPAAANYRALVTNVVTNRLDKQIRALPVAISDRCTVSDMHMRDSIVGTALHVFGSSIDYTGAVFEPDHLQGAIGVPIDVLCETFGMESPAYVKIDVDGLERAVVAGGFKTFRSCASVLVELDLNDPAEVEEITRAMNAAGLVRDDGAPGNVPRPHAGALVYNMIFRRASASR